MLGDSGWDVTSPWTLTHLHWWTPTLAGVRFCITAGQQVRGKLQPCNYLTAWTLRWTLLLEIVDTITGEGLG